jgi:hypothetical protein
MKKYLFGMFFTCLYSLSIAQEDKVITWGGDTIECTMPGQPWKDGLRPSSKYDNGYLRTVTFFTNDSLRIIEAGEIKGYYRKEHGKRYLCDGHFEARKIAAGPDLKEINWWRTGTGGGKDPENPWYFMSPVIKGKHASLYRIYRWCGRCMHPLYLVSRPGDEDSLSTKPVWTRKETLKLLSDTDIAEEMNDYWNKAKRKKIWTIVEHYNKLKEEAAVTIQNSGSN